MSTTTSTLVSVIIPCFNCRDYVSRALDSVYAQTHSNLDLLCVDDGSSDGTVDLLKEISDRSPLAMRVLELGRNSGACAARNAGLDLARGDYIQFLDSDDLLRPNKIAHQLELIEREPVKVDLVAAACVRHKEDGSEVVQRVDSRGPTFGLVASGLGITSANLWRTAALRRVNGFNVHMRSSQEYELMFRLLQDGANVLFDSMANTVIRRRSDSLSRAPARRVDVCRRFIELRLEMLNYIERQRAATPELRSLCYGMILRHLRQISAYDPRLAVRLHTDLIPEGFIPPAETARWRYRTMLRLLGFRRTQRIARLLGRSKI